MGGSESGRWGWGGSRATTDSLLRLDVRSLARAGALRPGVTQTISWTQGGVLVGAVTTRAMVDAVVLADGARGGSRSAALVRERMALARTSCPYGGTRPRFVCPGCGQRRAVLYAVAGRFRCRGCHDLAYASTREAAGDRAWRRAVTLRRRLGDPRGEPGSGVPAKPPRMRWATYTGLVGRLQAAEQAAGAAWAAELEGLLARLARRQVASGE